VCFYFNENGLCEFFDSYGCHPSFYNKDWIKWIDINSDAIIYNKKCIQSVLSVACGAHCLFYLYHRCNGFSMPCILNMYSNNFKKNDLLAEYDLEAHLNTDIVIDPKMLLVNQIARPKFLN
jgi:hypothetical protein